MNNVLIQFTTEWHFVVSAFALNVIFNHLNSWFNWDNYKMLISILYSSLNRNINIFMDTC